jgi:hypothetical protein
MQNVTEIYSPNRLINEKVNQQFWGNISWFCMSCYLFTRLSVYQSGLTDQAGSAGTPAFYFENTGLILI